MKCCNLFTVILITVNLHSIYAQSRAFKWHEDVGNTYLGLNVSTSRYCGDLSERYNLAHLQLGWSVEGHLRHRLKEQLSLRGDIGLYYIRADQRYTKQVINYLAFSSTNMSASMGVQWDFVSVDDNLRNVVYAFVTIGLTKISPSTVLNDKTYPLTTFQTEGKKYAVWVGQISYGLGFPIALNPSTQMSFEGRYTHVLSDYVDDVSSLYVDKSMATLVEKLLADKRLAEGLSPNPVGATRGNSERNDGYFLFTLQLVRKF